MARRILASKKGASSILVMLLMLVLVVFGIAALTTSLSGLRLGQKVSDWSSAYYGAEGMAARRWAEIDKAVFEASESGGDFLQTVSEKLSALDFDTQLEDEKNVITIAYDTWNEGTGLHTVLTLDMDITQGLYATEWASDTVIRQPKERIINRRNGNMKFKAFTPAAAYLGIVCFRKLLRRQ